MSEVYIRSQNKEKLLMLGSNGILRYYKEIGSNDNHMICFETKSEMYDLGKYESRARCLAILDEIQSKCGMYLKLEGGAALIRGEMDVQPAVFNIPKVYEMPKK